MAENLTSAFSDLYGVMCAGDVHLHIMPDSSGVRVHVNHFYSCNMDVALAYSAVVLSVHKD